MTSEASEAETPHRSAYTHICLLFFFFLPTKVASLASLGGGNYLSIILRKFIVLWCIQQETRSVGCDIPQSTKRTAVSKILAQREHEVYSERLEMKPTLTTRKSIVELSNLDLRTFPIWKFVSGEEETDRGDESLVKPVASTTIPLNCYSQIVAAAFHGAASSTMLNGYMIVNTMNDTMSFNGESTKFAAVAPGAIITESGLYQDIPVLPTPEELQSPWIATQIAKDRAELHKFLGLGSNQLFPLSYQLLVNIEGESSVRSGQID